MSCAIVCSGTSVTKEQLSKIDWLKIGVNWSYIGTPSDIHVLTNITFIKKHGHEFADLTPEAHMRFSAMPVQGAFVPDCRMKYCGAAYKNKEIIPKMPEGYDIFRDGWVFAGGGPCALQVAVSYGFTEIIFVGLDLYTGPNCHFYEDQRATRRSSFSGYSRKKLDQAWAQQIEYFRQVKPELDALGISVINTCLDSAEDVFEKIPFEQVFP